MQGVLLIFLTGIKLRLHMLMEARREGDGSSLLAGLPVSKD